MTVELDPSSLPPSCLGELSLKRNVWKLSTEKPVKNQDDFEELDRELADKSIEI
ncbi:ribonuclease H1 [Culex quinquefasciatus]|uniref:Ribonuclease H1 n=1 Tax=Culex quinquefasciatus TaxID=7176 RepID=B0WWG2_CULQU|nr:ribonuclease H1 [Culex quinquefasciatus]|eukprot:XP_001861734.1 ribonuclease H1 [Culex quinquefasciatus]